MFYNKIYQGDCKAVLLKMPENSVDLVYLDPPFFAGRNNDIVWHDGSEESLFEERSKGGITTFVEWMKLRMQLIHRVLKRTGSVYLHCDYRAVHYLRPMMDEVFDNNFRNDIIWGFRTGGAGGGEFAKKHNNILFYTKTVDYYFKPEDDIYYLIYYGGESHPYFVSYPALTKDFDREAVKIPKNIERKRTHMRDVWDDDEVKPLWNMGFSAEERVKRGTEFINTQKPENLLRRIIISSSREGQIVLDPFAGTGTTIAAAEKLGRKWIGIDVSPTACDVMRRRMAKLGIKTNIDVKTQRGINSAIIARQRLGFTWQDWICDQLQWVKTKHTGDGGVDGIYYNENGAECFGQVKLNEAGRPKLQQFAGALTSKGSKEGTFIAERFARPVYEENEKLKKQGYKITLLTKEEVFQQAESRISEARRKFR